MEAYFICAEPFTKKKVDQGDNKADKVSYNLNTLWLQGSRAALGGRGLFVGLAFLVLRGGAVHAREELGETQRLAPLNSVFTLAISPVFTLAVLYFLFPGCEIQTSTIHSCLLSLEHKRLTRRIKKAMRMRALCQN